MKALRDGIAKGAWLGGQGQAPEISQRPGIHVLAAGSNSAWTGFSSLEEAARFIGKGPADDLLLRIVDLRPMAERYPPGTAVRFACENSAGLRAVVQGALDDLTLRVLVDETWTALLRQDPGALTLTSEATGRVIAVQVEPCDTGPVERVEDNLPDPAP